MASSRKLSALTLLPHVLSRLRAHVRPHSQLCVGLSGGRDSVLLLHLLVQAREALAITVSAIHINHQISPHAASWADFCVALCAQLGVPLQVERVVVARDSGQGLEASARAARYAAYSRVPADMIALAHHRGDQAETVLLQALRGGGLKGISAMPLLKALGDAKQIIRPLLDVEPEIFADYAAVNGVSWIHDESNDDTRFTRNYIRHEIMPRLGDCLPQGAASLVRLGQHAAQAQLLLDDLAKIDRANVVVGDRLQSPRLLALSMPRAKNLLRYFFASASIPVPNAVQLNEILRQLGARNADHRTEITWANWTLRCFLDEVYLAPATLQPDGDWQIAWHGEAELILPRPCGTLRFEPRVGTGIAQTRLAGKNVTIRSRRGGEKIHLASSRPRRALKNLLQEAKLPPWRRETMPLLFCDETLVWVPGIGIDLEFTARADEPGLVIAWHAHQD